MRKYGYFVLPMTDHTRIFLEEILERNLKKTFCASSGQNRRPNNISTVKHFLDFFYLDRQQNINSTKGDRKAFSSDQNISFGQTMALKALLNIITEVKYVFSSSIDLWLTCCSSRKTHIQSQGSVLHVPVVHLCLQVDPITPSRAGKPPLTYMTTVWPSSQPAVETDTNSTESITQCTLLIGYY